MTTNGSIPDSVANGSLVIAGDDPSFRRRVLETLDPDDPGKVAEMAARPGLYDEVAALAPAIILYDVGRRTDIDALGMVSALSALSKVIVLADVDDDGLALEALKAGASGFCPRDTPPALIQKAVRLVQAGEVWVGRRVLLRLIEELTHEPPDRARSRSTVRKGHPLQTSA